MIYMNVATLLGKSGAPQHGKTANGTSFCRADIMTAESFSDNNGDEKTFKTFHRVVFWNKQADAFAEQVKEGDAVFVMGRLQTRQYEHDGVKKYVTEVVGREFVVSKLSNEELNQVTNKVKSEVGPDEIPF